MPSPLRLSDEWVWRFAHDGETFKQEFSLPKQIRKSSGDTRLFITSRLDLPHNDDNDNDNNTTLVDSFHHQINRHT